MCILITSDGRICTDVLWRDAYTVPTDHVVYFKGDNELETVVCAVTDTMLQSIQRLHPQSTMLSLLKVNTNVNVVATHIFNAFDDSTPITWKGHVVVGTLNSNHEITHGRNLGPFVNDFLY
tara:strand:- start:17044 stop:17406 length:363 start_codon:yes stop_codon:yes gene_type:complete